MTDTAILPFATDHNLQAEQSVLGTVLVDPEVIEPLVGMLSPDDFLDHVHRAIFASMTALHVARRGIDVTTLTQQMIDDGAIPAITGPAYLAELLSAQATVSDVQAHAEIVLRLSMRRQLDFYVRTGNYHLVADIANRLSGVGNETITKPSAAGVTAAQLLAMDLPEQRHIVPGMLAEGMGFLAARPKIGKTWLGIQLGISVASGTSLFGEIVTDPGDVLYLALEDNHRRLKSRLTAAIPTGQAPDRLTFHTEWPRLDQGGNGAIERWLQTHPDAKLVVIDTLARVKPRSKRNADTVADEYEAVAKLADIASNYRVAILVVTHTRKASAEDFLDAVMGTTGLTGAADTILVLRRERGQADATLAVTGRDVEEQELALKFDKELCTWQLLGDAVEYRHSKERQDIIDAIRAGGGAMAPKAVSEALMKNSGAVRFLMMRMKEDGQLKAWDDGKYSLPKKSTNPPNTTNSTNTANTTNSSVHEDWAVSAHGSVSGVSTVSAYYNNRQEARRSVIDEFGDDDEVPFQASVPDMVVPASQARRSGR